MSIVREGAASTGQRLLWFLDHYRAGAAALNCPVLCRLDGALDIERLQESVRSLVARHEALRTKVQRVGRHFRQIVHAADAIKVEIRVFDDLGDPERNLQSRIDAELRRRIDFADTPVRATLWKIARERYVLCLNVHHSVSDAWSGMVQLQDLLSLYKRPDGGSLAPPILQYIDFTARQENYLRGAAFERDVRFWRNAIMGARFEAVPLAPAGALQRRITGRARLSFRPEDTARITELARRSRTTLFNLMLSLYFVALYRLTGQRDLAVATLFANRLQPDLQNTVGFIANLAVVRTEIPAAPRFPLFQQRVQAYLQTAFAHQACPLHLLPAALTSCNGRRADESVFQMLPSSLGRRRIDGIDITVLTPEGLESRFDFEVTLLIEQEQMTVLTLWNRDRLPEAWVDAFLSEYRSSIIAVLNDRDWSFDAARPM